MECGRVDSPPTDQLYERTHSVGLIHRTSTFIPFQ